MPNPFAEPDPRRSYPPIWQGQSAAPADRSPPGAATRTLLTMETPSPPVRRRGRGLVTPKSGPSIDAPAPKESVVPWPLAINGTYASGARPRTGIRLGRGRRRDAPSWGGHVKDGGRPASALWRTPPGRIQWGQSDGRPAASPRGCSGRPGAPASLPSASSAPSVRRWGWGPDDVGPLHDSYLVDSASSHMLVSKIKPCMSKYKQIYGETANGSLNQLSFI